MQDGHIRPGSDNDWTTRVRAHLQRREYSRALQVCERALASDLDNPDALRVQGIVLQALRRPADAQRSFQRCLKARPADRGAWLRLAFVQEAQGNSRHAADSYRKAVELKPDDPDTHHNLARVLHGLGRLSQAETHYRTSLSFKNDAESLLGLAQVLYRTHRVDESRSCLERALELDPNNLRVLHMLANLLADLNEIDQAERLQRRLLRLNPADMHGYTALVEMDRLKPGDAYYERLMHLQRQAGSLPVNDRIQLEYTLGRLYDRMHDYDKAFQRFQLGARLQRRQIQFDAGARQHQLESYRRFFSRELFERRGGSGHASTLPVFIVGMPRSGSTLVEQILASHPEVTGGGELEVLPDLAAAIREQAAAGAFPDCIGALATGDLDRFGASYTEQLRVLDASTARFTDKMLSNYTLIGLIHLILPNSAIIYCRRHPVATCFSCYTNLFALGNHYTYDFDELAACYRIHEQFMSHWRDVLPENRVLYVDYENVVGDLESEARRVIDYCGLEWDPRCLEFHRTNRAVHTLSSTQVRKPLYASAVERWRSYEPYLEPMLEALRRHGVSLD